MANIYNSIKSCIYKSPTSEKTEIITDTNNSMDVDVMDADVIKETDAQEYAADKKTDEVTDPSKRPSMIWRVSSGLYNTATGAVGMGVGGVKWVAGKTYDVGSAVVSKVPKPSIPAWKRKDKKE